MKHQIDSRIVCGKDIADVIKRQVKNEVKDLTRKLKRKPQIVSLIVGDNIESKLYLKLRTKACEEVGIQAMQRDFSKNIREKDLINEIIKLNKDAQVDGILVQLPLPNQLSSYKILSHMLPEKDVEGFTPTNMGRLMNNDAFLVPCTPLAVMRILSHFNIRLEGSHVVIVNHSTVVGKPLALLCLKENATVSVAHVFTNDLKQITRKADVLVTAAGVPQLITRDHVKDNAVVIDVSIVKTDQGISGDVDFESVIKKTKLITPVPGGVGPVTIASSLENMVKITKTSIKVE